MQKFGIVSNEPLTDWQRDLVPLMEELSRHEIRGLAVVALTEGDPAELDWYWNMNLRDRQLAASAIQADVNHRIAINAVRMMLEEAEEENDEEPEDP